MPARRRRLFGARQSRGIRDDEGEGERGRGAMAEKFKKTADLNEESIMEGGRGVSPFPSLSPFPFNGPLICPL